jgi:hypothetical protein
MLGEGKKDLKVTRNKIVVSGGRGVLSGYTHTYTAIISPGHAHTT